MKSHFIKQLGIAVLILIGSAQFVFSQNTAKVFPLTGRNPQVTLSAANATRDGSGTVGTLICGVATGTQVTRVIWESNQATAAASSNMVGHLFKSTDSGSTWLLFDEVQMSAVTASTTAVGARFVMAYSGDNIIVLKNTTECLGVTKSIHAGVQDIFAIHAIAADF